jgi:hypothetical protein
MMKNILRGLAVGAVLLGGAACQDLDVVNTQAPDREQALARPQDVESLVAGTFLNYFQGLHGQPAAATCCSILHLFLNLGGEMTTTNQWWSTVPSLRQPRGLFNNSPDIPNFTGPHGPRDLWRLLNRSVSNAHDGLRAIQAEGIEFFEGNVNTTKRGEAFAKFMQGAAWGYLSVIFDQVIIIPETEALAPLPADLRQQAIGALTPYDVAVERAIESLQAAAAIAAANPFTIPAGTQWFGLASPMSSAQFIELANTMSARFLVLNARTPAERQAVDWNRVLQYTANGLTFDVGTQLSNNRISYLYAASQGPNPGQGFTCCYRMDYATIGPADVSGAYQAWIQAPLEERNRFDIVTPDRRITGATPTSNGAYLRYRADNNGFDPLAGTYFFSAYQWGRHAIRNGQGAVPALTLANASIAFFATADENRLLRAEALLHTGDLAGAAELINVTRTRQHNVGGSLQPGLPPVTATGVPQSDTCVPRTEGGACADLLTALRYERMLELAGLDALRGYADSRGFGILPDGTPLHFAVPGNEADVMGVPVYSFGGVGTEWGAVYEPVRLP